MSKITTASSRLRVPSRLAPLLLTMASCASTSPPPSDPHLSGQWQIDTAASDDVSRRVSQFVASAQSRYRQRARAVYGDAAGGPEGGAGGTARGAPDPGNEDLSMPLAPDFGGMRSRVLEAVAAPSDLTIATQGNDVELSSQGLPGRNYRPGETITRFDDYGAATITTRWSGSAFELHAHYTNRASLDERYWTDPKSGVLTFTRTLTDPQLGKLELHSRYRRQ